MCLIEIYIVFNQT